MPRRSSWPNEDMWKKAVELRKAGMAYGVICGKLTVLFRLEEVPSEETVRRHVIRLMSEESPEPDVPDLLLAEELKRHWDELEDFGKRLRALGFLLPIDAAALDSSKKELRLWNRDVRGKTDTKGWGLDAYDIRAEELYPYLQQHLAGNACWTILQQIEEQFLEYRKACAGAYKSLCSEIKKLLPHVSDTDLENMAKSLFTHAGHKASGGTGLIFSYEPKTVDGLHWYLQLGGWCVGSFETPELLETLADVHKELAGVLSKEEKLPGPLYKRAEFKNLTDKRASGSQAIHSFRDALSPDARLRKLICEGHCDLCPGPIPQAIVPNAQAQLHEG